MRALVVAALLAIPSALSAQGSPLIGTWNMSLPGGAKFENGVMTPMMTTGVLTVEATADSLVATLTMAPPEGQEQRPPSRFTTKLSTGNEVTFVQPTKGRMTRNDETVEMTGTATWVFKVNGDALEGTIERKLDGVQMAMGAQALKGTRKKA